MAPRRRGIRAAFDDFAGGVDSWPGDMGHSRKMALRRRGFRPERGGVGGVRAQVFGLGAACGAFGGFNTFDTGRWTATGSTRACV